MPSRSPFILSTQQDTGIQVSFVEGAGDQTASNVGGPSVTFSNVDVDNHIIAWAAGRNQSVDHSGSASVVNASIGGSLSGYSGSDELNVGASFLVDQSGSLTIENAGGKGGVLGAVVLQDGFDFQEDSDFGGNSVSISGCTTSDVLLYWECVQDTTTIPSTPSGYTSIASGTGYSGQGGGATDYAYRLSYKDNPSGTEALTVTNPGTPSAGQLVRVYRVLKDYELSTYGSPDYTITSFPSTSSGVASGANDMLVALDTTIDYAAGSGDEGLIMEAGGTGAGFSWGIDNGTQMKARCFDGGGNFRDGGTDALAAADIFVSISAYQNRFCTYYISVDNSAYTMRLYVQPGGRGGPYPIRLLQSNTSDQTYNTNVYGSAGKGYGQANGAVADLVGAGGTGAYEDNYTGTLDEIRYWAEAGAPDVSGFAASYDTV